MPKCSMTLTMLIEACGCRDNYKTEKTTIMATMTCDTILRPELSSKYILYT